MEKFCTNCGHQNKQENKVCIECGMSLTKEDTQARQPEKAPWPLKSKKPVSLKAKIFTITASLLAVSMIGVYSWGIKAASAETAVSKFFEALHKEDAEALAKHVVLSDGGTLTSTEAKAFMQMYGDITPEELRDMASVEKNGKVIGIIDAHKVVLPTQKVSFSFPYEGLALTLNGEKVPDMKNVEGEYTFWNLSPGLYDAEFVYEGEFAKFNYPFDLSVELQGDSSWVAPIYEELPVDATTFKLGTYNAEDIEANKIIINDLEIPVGEEGESDLVGPLLLDGSVTAQAEINFPWGKQLSEPVEITSNYHEIDFTGLGEKQQTAMIDQLAVFAEEYVKTYATRDPSALSTVTKEQKAVFVDSIEAMKSNEQFLKGSLTEIGIDEESVQISEDGQSVNISAELVIQGAYYYPSEIPEMDSIVKEVSLDFIYDETSKKWLVDSFDEDRWFFDVTPTLTIEGSQKVYNTASTTKAAAEEEKTPQQKGEGEYLGLQIDDIENFFSGYNDASVSAINSGDFKKVSALILQNGPRYKEQSDFVANLFSKGVTEEHLGTSVEKVEVIDNQFLEVTTIEKFIIHGTESSDEKSYRTVTKMTVKDGEQYIYELLSTKEI